MTSPSPRRRRPHPLSVRRRIAPSRLDAMIEEAIVDAYTESEEAVGFHATIDQHLELPFEIVILGVAVIVKKVDVTAGGDIIAVCYRGRERQAIPILELPLPDPPPASSSPFHQRLQSRQLGLQQSALRVQRTLNMLERHGWRVQHEAVDACPAGRLGHTRLGNAHAAVGERKAPVDDASARVRDHPQADIDGSGGSLEPSATVLR
ncbi:MAG: hypothetical protein ACRD2N_17370 [Vicinamibacterales bacterium]